MVAVTVVAAGLGTAVCHRGTVAEAANWKCGVVVVSDTVRVSANAGEHKLMMSSTQDTVSKPYMTCLTLYASASDTVSKPRP
jgi:nicotinamidase-related amidase